MPPTPKIPSFDTLLAAIAIAPSAADLTQGESRENKAPHHELRRRMADAHRELQE